MSQPSDSPYDFAPPKPAPAAEGASAGAPKPAAPAVPRQPLPERSCPQCGARFIGKPRHNRCPDCRAPLDESVADLLQFSYPGRIRRLSWGALALALAVPAHVGGVLVTHVAKEPVPGAGLQALGAILTLGGIWILTTREEGMPQRRAALGVMARVLAVAVAGLLAVATYLISRNSGATTYAIVPAISGMAAEAVAFGLFASSLAARIPHDGLINQLRNFALLLPPFLAAVLVSLFVDLSPYYAAFFCTFPLIGGMLGLMAWVAVTLLRLMLELRHVAQAADAIVLKRFQKAKGTVTA